MGYLQGTTPSALWVKDLDALGDVLDEIAEAGRKQDVEDAKQRKLAGKRKVQYSRVQCSTGRYVACTPRVVAMVTRLVLSRVHGIILVVLIVVVVSGKERLDTCDGSIEFRSCLARVS